jgi:hypothetical protein
MSETPLSFEFAPQTIPNTGSDFGTSLTVWNGNLYACWKGGAGDARLWYSCFDGNSWEPQQMMPEDFLSCHGPSFAIFRNSMYVAFNDPNRDLWWSRFDGTSWQPKERVGGRRSDRSPALMVYRGALNLAHRENSPYGPNHIWWIIYDGAVWKERDAPRRITTERPALEVYDKKLVLVHKGNDDDETLHYSTLDGLKWSDQQTIGGSTDSSPSLANYQGRLYAAWKEAGDDQAISYSTYDGKEWTASRMIEGLEIGSWPSLAVFNEQLYVVWRGWDTKLWWTRITPTGLAGKMPVMDTVPSTEATSPPIAEPIPNNPVPQQAPLSPVQEAVQETSPSPIQPTAPPVESPAPPIEPQVHQIEQPASQPNPTPVASPYVPDQSQYIQHPEIYPVPPETYGPPVVPASSASRRSSSSSDSNEDLRRLKKGVKKGVAELTGKFKSKFHLS